MPEAQDSPESPRPAGPASRPPRPPVSPAPFVLVIGLVVAAYYFGRPAGRGRLVVYCAHDSVYSGKILREFEKRTGVAVATVFDTEATKSLGLVERIVRERDAPRCDVFWNNEILGTMDLREKGILLPYKGAGFERIPAAFRDADGHWVGFAARLRVWIVNTERVEAPAAAIAGTLKGDLSRAAIAKPLYGTTLTHYSVLWDAWGAGKLKAWHRDWRGRGVREVLGNATVKNLVARGVCDLGLTDTDDFFVAKDEGRPVAMLPVRVDGRATICIPNTVAIVKGTGRVEQAKRLVDYLLSEECELALANSKSRQVPLGPVDEKRLPEEVRELAGWAAEGYPLSTLSRARAECLGWLKSEYLK